MADASRAVIVAAMIATKTRVPTPSRNDCRHIASAVDLVLRLKYAKYRTAFARIHWRGGASGAAMDLKRAFTVTMDPPNGRSRS
jgi:hypothetical protein